MDVTFDGKDDKWSSIVTGITIKLQQSRDVIRTVLFLTLAARPSLVLDIALGLVEPKKQWCVSSNSTLSTYPCFVLFDRSQLAFFKYSYLLSYFNGSLESHRPS